MSLTLKKYIENKNFSLQVKTADKNTQILFKMLIPIFTTADLPHTLETLKQMVPCVLQTKCFNDKNLPFNKEVESTEIAHLFEHLILALTQENIHKISQKNPMFEGVTEWDWSKDPKGSFVISMDIGQKDWQALELALNQSVDILDIIFNQNESVALKQVA